MPEIYFLEVVISPGSENSVIEFHAKLITGAVNNLFQNSIHSNPKGCTIIMALQATWQAVKEKLLLTVQDDGIGISAEKLEELKTSHIIWRVPMTV